MSCHVDRSGPVEVAVFNHLTSRSLTCSSIFVPRQVPSLEPGGEMGTTITFVSADFRKLSSQYLLIDVSLSQCSQKPYLQNLQFKIGSHSPEERSAPLLLPYCTTSGSAIACTLLLRLFVAIATHILIPRALALGIYAPCPV